MCSSGVGFFIVPVGFEKKFESGKRTVEDGLGEKFRGVWGAKPPDSLFCFLWVVVWEWVLSTGRILSFVTSIKQVVEDLREGLFFYYFSK